MHNLPLARKPRAKPPAQLGSAEAAAGTCQACSNALDLAVGNTMLVLASGCIAASAHQQKPQWMAVMN